MFSGKTEELLRRIKRSVIAKQPTILFKPKLDTRYSTDHVVSHDQVRYPSVAVKDPHDMIRLAKDSLVVGVDEAQFFPVSLVEVCNELAMSGKRVIVAGLDQDYRGQPFHPLPELLAIAEYVTKHLAICAKCGNPATRNQRLVAAGDQVLLGSLESYEARCRKCFEPPQEARAVAAQS
ncbi:MAG: thymidine kinase [Deltaproteobacteria bacterium]|nr:thymidine kinase [Deltaproteobacteria bacterium]